MEQQPTTSQRATKAAGMIAGMILFSRLLGFVRETISGRLFNRAETDAFFAAFGIPDFMYYLLVGGALSAAFIPLFTEYLTRNEEEEGWRMASTFINFTVLLLLSLTVLGMIFSRQLAPLEAHGFEGEKLELLIALTRVMFPAVFFTALAGLMGGVLNSYQHFFAPALGPVVYNVGIIMGAYFLGPRYGIFGMAVGVVVGAAANFLTQACYAARLTRGYLPGYINLKHPGIRRMFLLMIPALLGLSATQLNILVTNTMASVLKEGSITALRFANRLILLPLGIFAMAISTAFFPTLSRLTAEGKWEEFRRTLAMGIRMILFVTIPSAVGFLLLRVEIVRLLFEGQKFTPAHTQATAYALAFYCLGLFAHGAIQLLPRGFYSLKDTKTPVLITVVTVIISIALNYLFLRFTNLQHGGFALSFSIMGILNMALSLYFLRRKVGGIDGRNMAKTFLQASLAAAVMGLALAWCKPWLAATMAGLRSLLVGRGVSLDLGDLGLVAVAMTVGVGVYFGMAYLLRMDEVKLLGQILRRRKSRA
ncbi:MAG TPA: murein biosynthesis integral membrane protein MurJ [Bacillota bacterium]|nr:murein biosynthesis integral membrane protein MurJ [Bacillota bacterium]